MFAREEEADDFLEHDKQVNSKFFLPLVWLSIFQFSS